MSRRRWALLAGVFLVGCSSTNTNDAPGTSGGGVEASAVGPEGGRSDATVPTVTQTVGAAGGTLQAPGAMLTIPAGALSSNVVISVTPEAASVPPEYTAFSPVFRFEPSGTTFLTPVTIALTLTTPAANATVFELNAAGGYDGLVTTTNGTTASAATLRLGDFFAGAPNADVDSGLGGNEAGPLVDDSSAMDASTPEDASAAEAGLTSDSDPTDRYVLAAPAGSDVGVDRDVLSVATADVPGHHVHALHGQRGRRHLHHEAPGSHVQRDGHRHGDGHGPALDRDVHRVAGFDIGRGHAVAHVRERLVRRSPLSAAAGTTSSSESSATS